MRILLALGAFYLACKAITCNSGKLIRKLLLYSEIVIPVAFYNFKSLFGELMNISFLLQVTIVVMNCFDGVEMRFLYDFSVDDYWVWILLRKYHRLVDAFASRFHSVPPGMVYAPLSTCVAAHLLTQETMIAGSGCLKPEPDIDIGRLLSMMEWKDFVFCLSVATCYVQLFLLLCFQISHPFIAFPPRPAFSTSFFSLASLLFSFNKIVSDSLASLTYYLKIMTFEVVYFFIFTYF